MARPDAVPADGSVTRTSGPVVAPVPVAQAVRDVLVVWLVSRVVITGLAAVTVALFGPADDAEPGFFGLLHHWDSNWFDAILRDGYFGPSYVDASVPGARAAFFPGYPLAARGLAWLFGGGGVTGTGALAGLWCVPFAASLVAAFFLHRTVAARWGLSAARGSVVLLLLGPYAVFLAASYSEALFLAFAIAAWWAMERRWFWLAGVLAAGASFTRVNGLFLAVALVVLYLQQQRERGERPRVLPVVAVAVSGAGAAAYLGWLWGVTGSPTAWFSAQGDRFGRQGTWPWISLWNAMKLVLTDQRFDYRIQHAQELLFFGVIVVAVVVFVRARQWAAAVFTALSCASLVTNVSFLSLGRNTLTLIPLFVLGGVLMSRSPHRRWVRAGLALVAVLFVVNTGLFALGYWAD